MPKTNDNLAACTGDLVGFGNHVGIGAPSESDLRFQAPLLGKSGLTEPVAGVGFEVQSAVHTGIFSRRPAHQARSL